ncbi:NAD(P)/FAD-dependent oxidoreductase [Ketogulonicigenium vulgare]|uniref:NADH:ubiquinone reductase (non-electrogenic) n=1 Tax=Ketogulonicigenium vulgare (strain WSH-001) TaxID=759362 RepID=F9Y7P8_KETVW|nr:NAD(P)/FAD-dependent oxidoreductase [Ketogulonicigenium vulgare]ADO41627.1 NADH dehydrogenase protein [Ketogulonicigenium vulgare Y25]AEM39864.1 putative NADH dehydrogenase transmembrane protein [Ketogulonicigenium vulgare WSH-001]ALJ80083.1 NADH dehydrogenase [Ketogulonicigenium vulgare]ANW32956.1 NADH dehydrogenase [Ketogulonicigenium vulgare]AOZ53558.1 NADH dehydrogenase protein [Ketogulonicigenium vulgare]
MAHRVVVVGAGFAGLQLVQNLKGSGCDITLIDQRNHHLFQPLLYQVATTLLATSEIAWPIRRLMRPRKDVTTLLATVDGVDRETREVLLRDGTRVPYDTLVLATGARHAYFGRDEWEADAPGLKTLEDATTIRRRLLLAFERAELTTDPAEREALLTFAIIGAGPTGVELAGIIAELAHRILPREFRRIDTDRARIMLIEAGPRILPAFSPNLSDYAAQSLQKVGVEVLTGKPVTQISDKGIVLGDEPIAARTVIWAAGVQASRAKDWLGGVEADRAGRVMVQPDLTLAGAPDIFVLGDTAHVESDGKPVPGVAPAAKQQGEYAAKLIRTRLEGKDAPAPFKYKHMGNLATIGRNSAVIEFGKFQMRGWLAWWIWGFAHIYFLIGTRSRIVVLLSWLWIFISGQNSARLITQKETLKDDV